MLSWLFGGERKPRVRRNDEARAAATADRLIDMGYLKFVPPDDHPVVRADMIESLRDGVLDAKHDWHGDARDGRGYDADAEDLAEGKVGATILRMADALRAEGVAIGSVADHPEDDEGGYEVVIDGARHVIWTEADDGQDAWNLATRRLLEIVSALLREAGSDERLFGVYGGHKGRAVLLTREMHAYLTSLGPAIDPRWMPTCPHRVCT